MSNYHSHFDHEEPFHRYLRGDDPRGIFVRQNGELRAMTVTNTGVVGNQAFREAVTFAMKSMSGVREAGATAIPTDSGTDLPVPLSDDTSNEAQESDEATTDNTEADPDTTHFAILKAFKYDSKWIKVSTEMAQDAGFPIWDYLAKVAGERINRTLNPDLTSGAGGIDGPKGFSTASGTGKVAAATNAITYEEILDLVHSVDAAYRATGRCVLMFHDQTLAAIRKLKDGDNHYIFPPGTGDFKTLGDYPYVINNDMPTLSSGAGSAVVAYGDFSTYFVRDVQPTVVVATELFSGQGCIGYRVYSRHDGNLVDTKAIKLLKLATS